MSGGPRTRMPNKVSLAMRHILEERGVDIVAMQIEVYTKAMHAFDNHRGDNEKSDAGSQYLSVCNTAIATLAKYAFPTMTAIKIEDLSAAENTQALDAVAIRQRILNDPFAKNVANASKLEPVGVPILAIGKKDD